MATPIIKKVFDELTCPICQDRLKVPKSLNCLHCLCKECLKLLIATVKRNKKKSFNCPVCKQDHDIQPNGADAYKTHFTFSNLIEILRISEEAEEETIKCNSAEDQNPAVAYCAECACYLCKECVTIHARMRVTRSHQTVPIADIKADPKKMDQKRYCSEHKGEELKLYCEEDEEVVCRDCILEDRHKDHSHRLIKNVVPDLKKRLEGLVKVIGEKSEEVDQYLALIDDVTTQSDRNIKQCRQKITKFFYNYRARLKAAETQLYQRLDMSRDGHYKFFTTEKEAVELRKLKLVNAKAFTDQLLKKGTQVEVAMMSKQTRNRLTDLKKEFWDKKTLQLTKLAFVGNQIDPLKSIIRGGISRSEITVEGLTQPIKGNNQFKVTLDKGVVSSSRVVVTLTRNGERVQDVIEVAKESNHCWNIKYQISVEGEYEIGVSIDGVEAEESPFKRIWHEQLVKGMTVVRGRDWKWGNLDGGAGNQGTVLGPGVYDNYVRVKWKNSRENHCRWGPGARGFYDLMILNSPDLKSSW